jgi:hypothetical protein
VRETSQSIIFLGENLRSVLSWVHENGDVEGIVLRAETFLGIKKIYLWSVDDTAC